MEKRLKQLRKSFGETQAEFAKKLGVARSTYAKYESGENLPISAVVSLICEKCNVNEEWLRTGEGEMFQPEPVDPVEAIIQKYGLSPMECSLLHAVVSLPPSDREALVRAVGVIQRMSAVTGGDSEVSDGVSEAERQDLIEEFKRELSLEKRAPEKSSRISG